MNLKHKPLDFEFMTKHVTWCQSWQYMPEDRGNLGFLANVPVSYLLLPFYRVPAHEGWRHSAFGS